MEIKTCEQYVLDQLEQARAERDWLRGKLEQAQDEAEELRGELMERGGRDAPKAEQAYRGKPAGECPDGPRHKAIGNGTAVPVMRWIGEVREKRRNGIGYGRVRRGKAKAGEAS